MAPRSRAGSVLAVVLLCSAVIGVSVFAMHFLWQGSARTLFSVQEQRELVNLARSAVAEIYFEAQRQLDRTGDEWLRFCTQKSQPAPKEMQFALAKANAAQMCADASFLAYEVQGARIERVVGLDRNSDGGKMGILDFKVLVSVTRKSPLHQATLTLTERRYFWLADNLGPYRAGGRHVDLAPTAAMTAIERGTP